MNEFKILQKWQRKSNDPLVFLGQGDDCSLIDFDDTHFLISSTDLLIEDVHFRRSSFTIPQIATKALAVNVSDISAMGGAPRWLSLSLAIPETLSERDVDDFFSHLLDECEKQKISLLGGDLSKSPGPLMIDMHISTLIKKDRVKLRQGLRSGTLCVSGPVGLSAAGLYCLENNISGYDDLIEAHRKPPVETQKALWLSARKDVLGMMDLSDGLFSDLERIADSQAKIHLDAIPTSESVLKLAHAKSINQWNWIVGGGEDYRLLFSVDSSSIDEFRKDWEKEFSQPLSIIGSSREGRGGTQWCLDKKPYELSIKNFLHFSDAND